MDNKELLSVHKLTSDYSLKGKLRPVIIGWIIFLAIFIVTRLPVVRQAVFQFAANFNHSGLSSSSNFIFNGLWILFISMVIGTVIQLRKKHPFNELRLYSTGIGFVSADTGAERYAPYSGVRLSHGKMQQSICIAAPEAGVAKEAEYGWGEFTQPDVLRNNLERYTAITA